MQRLFLTGGSGMVGQNIQAHASAKNWDIFRTIILPLSMPGVIAGCLLVFIPAVGEFVIPALLGGPEQLMLGKVIWTEFFRNRDWPVAAAIAIILIAIIILPIVYARYQDKESISCVVLFRYWLNY